MIKINKSWLQAIIFLILSTSILAAQEISFGLGFEINQTRFRQDAPTIQVAFSNPHMPNIGISAHGSINAIFKKKIALSLKPGVSILRTKSEVTSNQKISFVNLSMELGYYLTKKFKLSAGAEYSYLERLISTYNKQSADFTFFVNHRNFISPTLRIEYDLDKIWSAHFRFIYFTKDLFNSGALDKDGNIVGPVMVTPYVFGLGVNCNFKI